MSRQDANAAFALTSFLYGANAPYIEDLYARYEIDPKSVDAEWQSFFQSLKDDPREVSENARGPSWRRSDWPLPERSELVAALDGDWTEVGKALGEKVKAKAQTKGVETLQRRRRARYPQLDPRTHAHPRLSRARTFPRPSRSARAAAAG